MQYSFRRKTISRQPRSKGKWLLIGTRSYIILTGVLSVFSLYFIYGRTVESAFLSIANVVGRKTIWVPGYPGSGNDLVRTITRHLTGFSSGDIHKNSCGFQTVTCKTHWPMLTKYPPVKFGPQPFSSSAIFLIRNPLKAIPSRVNYGYERHRQLGDHTSQAPEDYWLRYRDRKFKRDMAVWKDVVRWWMSSTTFQVRVILQYERLVNAATGPPLLQAMGYWLQEAGFPIIVDDLQRAWDWCVNRNATVKRAPHKYKPQYTDEQLIYAMDRIKELLEEYGGDGRNSQLTDALRDYLQDMESLLVHVNATVAQPL